MSSVISARCQSCGLVVQVPAAYAGKRGTCSRCGNIVFVPRPASNEGELVNDEELEEVAVGRAGEVFEAEEVLEAAADLEEKAPPAPVRKIPSSVSRRKNSREERSPGRERFSGATKMRRRGGGGPPARRTAKKSAAPVVIVVVVVLVLVVAIVAGVTMSGRPEGGGTANEEKKKGLSLQNRKTIEVQLRTALFALFGSLNDGDLEAVGAVADAGGEELKTSLEGRIFNLGPRDFKNMRDIKYTIASPDAATVSVTLDIKSGGNVQTGRSFQFNCTRSGGEWKFGRSDIQSLFD